MDALALCLDMGIIALSISSNRENIIVSNSLFSSYYGQHTKYYQDFTIVFRMIGLIPLVIGQKKDARDDVFILV